MELGAVEGQERSEFCVTICVLLSIHDDLLSPLECQRSGKHRIQINHHKKVLLRQLVLNNINIELSLQKNEDKGERLYQYPFYTLKRPTETFTFIYFHFAVWLWPMYLTPLVSSFLICKIEVIIVFTSNVILRIKRNIACEMFNTRLGKKCSGSYCSLCMSSEFSQQSLKKKKKKQTIMWYDKYYKNHLM